MKTLKKVTAKTSELMLKKNEEVTKINEEISQLNKVIEVGRELLLSTDDTEEYTETKKEVELNEQLVVVLKRKLKNVSTPLNDDEFKSMKSEVIEAHGELMSEYSARLNKELTTILGTMSEYMEKVEFMSGVMKDLEDLNGMAYNARHTLRADAIIGAITEDREEWLKRFILWYFKTNMQVDALKRAGVYR